MLEIRLYRFQTDRFSTGRANVWSLSSLDVNCGAMILWLAEQARWLPQTTRADDKVHPFPPPAMAWSDPATRTAWKTTHPQENGKSPDVRRQNALQIAVV